MKDPAKSWLETLRTSLKGLEVKGFSFFQEIPKEARPSPLVKPRPASLEQRYQLLEHSGLADEVFRRLQQKVFQAIAAQEGQRRGPSAPEAVFRELGRLHPGRLYFFVKPRSHKGWLFERSGSGWLVTPAEKIVARDLFLREEQPIDQVLLYIAQDQATMPRVKARSMGDDLLALSYYEQKVLQQLGLA